MKKAEDDTGKVCEDVCDVVKIIFDRLGGVTLMMTALASCAAGTFAFTMACVIIWIKHQVE